MSVQLNSSRFEIVRLGYLGLITCGRFRFSASATPAFVLQVSQSNPEWAEVKQDSEGEDGRKASDVGERDRVEVFCGKCGNM